MLKIKSDCPNKTMEIGAKLGKLLRPGDFLNLNGDLGAGKTLLVKGVGLSLGISPAEITSPTFTIINEYEGIHRLYHFDLYRLRTELELEQVGYLDYFYGNGITAVEWGNLFEHHLPEDRVDVDLISTGPEKRELTVSARGGRGREIADRLRGLL